MVSTAPITVVIPARNESGTISKVVHECMKSKLVREVIVSNNASTDDTALLATKAGARVVNCSVPGFGATLKAGFSAAETKWVFKIDADILNTQSHWIEDFWNTREREASLVSGQWPHDQQYWAMTYFVIKPFVDRYFHGLKHVALLNSGMYLVDKSGIDFNKFGDGWGFDTAVHINALAKGYDIRVHEIEPVVDYLRPHSQYLKMAADTIDLLLDAAGLATREENSKMPLSS
ncbi:MAG: glycosyltransferase [Rhizomicrobium sp.]